MFQSDFRVETPVFVDMQYYTQSKDKTCKLPCNSIILFILLGFLFILIGIASLVANFQANSLSIPLTQQGSRLVSSPAFASFTTGSAVGVYFKIQKLTQYDHFASAQSWQIQAFTPDASTCQSYSLNGQLNKSVAIDGTTLPSGGFAVPCGLYAGMFPEGAVVITMGNGSVLPVNRGGLTVFDYDVWNFNRSAQWADLTSAAFQSWMEQNAAIPTTKLMGTLGGGFEGLLQISVQLSNGLPMRESVVVVLSELKAFGTTNLPFCAINFVQSACLFFFAFVVFTYNRIIRQEIKESDCESHEIELKSQSEGVSVKTGEE